MMFLKGNSDSTLISPLINRTSIFPRLCYKFRYMMFGKGSMSLRFSVKMTSKDAIIPVWIDEDSSKMKWKSGEIPIRSMVPFQVSKVNYTRGHCLIPIISDSHRKISFLGRGEGKKGKGGEERKDCYFLYIFAVEEVDYIPISTCSFFLSLYISQHYTFWAELA